MPSKARPPSSPARSGGSRATLEQERLKLARLSGELSAIRGAYTTSTQDASVSNRVEGELVAAYQKLSAEMQRLLKQRAKRPANAAIGGIPVDSEYVIFVVDTSDSMTDNHWDANLALIDEILSFYPHVLGLQIMNDQGAYMFESTKGKWLTDSADQRAEIRKRAKHWAAFSQSNPVPGMEEAIRTYWATDKRISVFVLAMSSPVSPYKPPWTPLPRSISPARMGGVRCASTPSVFPKAPGCPPTRTSAFPP